MKKELLKYQLKSIYIDIQKFDYNCGHQMMCNISSDYYNLCKRFNETADKLSKVDSNCPLIRYELK